MQIHAHIFRILERVFCFPIVTLFLCFIAFLFKSNSNSRKFQQIFVIYQVNHVHFIVDFCCLLIFNNLMKTFWMTLSMVHGEVWKNCVRNLHSFTRRHTLCFTITVNHHITSLQQNLKGEQTPNIRNAHD